MTIVGYRSSHTTMEFHRLALVHVKLLIRLALVAEVTCRVFACSRALNALVTKGRTLIRLEFHLFIRDARHACRMRFSLLARSHFYL